MSWRKPEAAGAGRIHLLHPDGEKAGRPLELIYDGRDYEARIEPIDIQDGRLRSSWGDRVFRIVLTAKSTARQGTCLISIQ